MCEDAPVDTEPGQLRTDKLSSWPANGPDNHCGGPGQYCLELVGFDFWGFCQACAPPSCVDGWDTCRNEDDLCWDDTKACSASVVGECSGGCSLHDPCGGDQYCADGTCQACAGQQCECDSNNDAYECLNGRPCGSHEACNSGVCYDGTCAEACGPDNHCGSAREYSPHFL